MGSFSIWHWLIVLAVALLLFGGGGKISKIMGDLGSGMRSFRRNLSSEEEDEDEDEDEEKSASSSKKSKKKKSLS